jgi:DNA-binding response OmpR family regulator
MIALVVDDDPAIRDFIKAVLQREGFVTLEAEGGRRALEIVEVIGGGIGLIVTDLQMPDGDGLTFANEVRRRFPTLPILIASGLSRPEEPFEFLEKPFTWAAVQLAVQRLLGSPAKSA